VRRWVTQGLRAPVERAGTPVEHTRAPEPRTTT
jgi:hypothetical protein